MKWAGFVLAMFPVWIGTADAQVMQPPTRAAVVQSADPNQVTQDLKLRVNFLGGYDADNSPEGSTISTGAQGHNLFGDVEMRYRAGRESRSLEVSGSGFVSSYRGTGLPPSIGGNFRAAGATRLGNRHRLAISQTVRNQPFLGLTTFTGLRPDVENGSLPENNPTNGFFESRSISSSSQISLERRMGSRNSLSGGYWYDDHRFEVNERTHTRTHSASLGYQHSLGRRVSARANYNYSSVLVRNPDGRLQPVRNHSATLGYEYLRNFSRTRRVTFASGAGSAYVETTEGGMPFSYWTPSGFAGLRFDLARTWSVSANYRRSISLLEGLSAEPFATDAVMMSAGGFLQSRFEMVIYGAYSHGQTVNLLNQRNQNEIYSATGQLRYVVNEWSSLTLNHTLYAYSLQDVGSFVGLPTQLTRNALRIGVVLDVPVYGSGRTR